MGPEFSSQLIMLKESFRKVIICRHEPGYFFRDCFLMAALRSRLSLQLEVAALRHQLCLLLISSAAEILGFPTNVSQCEQSVRVRQALAKSLGR